MSQEALPYILLAFIVGISIGYAILFGKRRTLEATVRTEREERARQQTANERIPALDAEIKRLTDAVIRPLESDRARLTEKAERIPQLESTIKAREQTLEGAQRQINDLHAAKERLEAELEGERNNFKKLNDAREELLNQFEAISKRVLSTSNNSFLTLAEQQLGKYQEAAKGDLEKRQQAIRELVSPFETKLREFEQKVDEVYRQEAAERNSLRGEIGKLVEQTQLVSREASNLALALKGDTKKQGNWGELILEKVLEFSGLRKGEEYRLQDSFRDGQERKIPDAVIYLPDKKNILIDAKVSLTAYDRCISAPTDGERDAALLEHIASVKKHIKELSEKNYFLIPELDAPEFTLLFMPIESSFGLAVQADNELFGFAWDRKIVIVSPSTLLATLRTIASIWKQERQTKNALEIADRAGKMYDKFVGFAEDMIAVGKKMDDAKSGYSSAMNKLSTGTGNLVRQAEVLRDMGAKATKQLPAALVDRASEAIPMDSLAAGPEGVLAEG